MDLFIRDQIVIVIHSIKHYFYVFEIKIYHSVAIGKSCTINNCINPAHITVNIEISFIIFDCRVDCIFQTWVLH